MNFHREIISGYMRPRAGAHERVYHREERVPRKRVLGSSVALEGARKLGYTLNHSRDEAGATETLDAREQRRGRIAPIKRNLERLPIVPDCRSPYPSADHAFEAAESKEGGSKARGARLILMRTASGVVRVMLNN